MTAHLNLAKTRLGWKRNGVTRKTNTDVTQQTSEHIIYYGMIMLIAKCYGTHNIVHTINGNKCQQQKRRDTLYGIMSFFLNLLSLSNDLCTIYRTMLIWTACASEPVMESQFHNESGSDCIFHVIWKRMLDDECWYPILYWARNYSALHRESDCQHHQCRHDDEKSKMQNLSVHDPAAFLLTLSVDFIRPHFEFWSIGIIVGIGACLPPHHESTQWSP